MNFRTIAIENIHSIPLANAIEGRKKHDDPLALCGADCTGVCCFAAERETCPLLPLLYLSRRNFKWIGFGRKRDSRAKIDARIFMQKCSTFFSRVDKYPPPRFIIVLYRNARAGSSDVSISRRKMTPKDGPDSNNKVLLIAN